MKKCVIVSGAPVCNTEFLKNNISRDDFVISADSGYIHCLNADIFPDLIIGDFDSSAYPEINTEIVKLNPEKAHTDTFSCVIEAVNRGYDRIDIFNALGSRFDHSYANVLMLSYCIKNNVYARIINEKNRISVVKGTGIINKDYKYFSVFAFLGDVVGLKIKGAYYSESFYDMDSLNISQDDLITQCNYVVDDYATIMMESGIVLLVESND